MALTDQEKQVKEQQRLARLEEERKRKEQEAYIDYLIKQAKEEKVKADLNKYTFEKMDYFIKAHSIAEEYYALLDKQEQSRKQREEEMISKLNGLKEAADTGNVDQWIKENSDGKESLEEVLKDTE